jgi:hypothetical protein
LIKSRDGAVCSALLGQLAYWQSGSKELLELIDRKPILKEIRPHAEVFKAISELMPKLVGSIYSGDKPEASILSDAEALLKANTTPYGQAELMILKGLETVVKHYNP